MKKMLFFVLIASFLSCKKEVKIAFQKKESLKLDLEKNHKKLDTVAYFENALIYEYEQNDKKEELWIYVNEQKKELLFVPNDDMIQAVISYPDGTYKIFGTNEKGIKIVLTQSVNAVSGQEIGEPMIKKTSEKRIISQKNIQQKNIYCEGFILNYLKMEGGEIVFATTEIPINSFQLYGFSRLDGDCKLPINLEYSNVFKKNQLLTHVERQNFKLQLLNYGPNPYEFNLKEYKEKE